MPRRVECPMCHKTAEIASSTHFLYAHQCPIGGWWYSNGIIWANTMEEIVGVERAREATVASCQDGQVSGEVIQAQFKPRIQNPEGAS